MDIYRFILLKFSLLLCQGKNISGSYFNCPTLSTSGNTPTSVHELTPNDIKVVGAMGDSFAAGFGTSWSGGRLINIIYLFT